MKKFFNIRALFLLILLCCNFSMQASQTAIPSFAGFHIEPQPSLGAFLSVAQGLSWGPIALLGIVSLLSSSTVRDWLSKYLAIKGVENITGSLGKKCSNFIDAIGHRWGFGKTAAKERKKRAAKKRHHSRGVQTNRIKTLAEEKTNNEKEIEKLRDEIKSKDQEIKSKIEEFSALHKEIAVLSTTLNTLKKENVSIKEEKTVLFSELDKLKLSIHSTQVAATAQYSGAEECQRNLSKLYEKTKAELEKAKKDKEELIKQRLEDVKQIGQSEIHITLLKQQVQELKEQLKQPIVSYNVEMPESYYSQFNPKENASAASNFVGLRQLMLTKNKGPSFFVPRRCHKSIAKSFLPNTITIVSTSQQLDALQLDALDLLTRRRTSYVRMPVGALSHLSAHFNSVAGVLRLPK